MRYDIKPDYHIKAKRRCLMALYIGLFLALLDGSVLWHFSSNGNWRNALAILSMVLCLLLAGVAYSKYRKLMQDNEKETY